MIRIFTGNWRGPQLSETRTFIQIDVRFREILHKFKGAKLAVLFDIILHVDADGVAFPSYDLIEQETGYGRGTIATALDELCKMEIDGAPVLMRWRERADDGTFDGPNRYKIFPTKNEIDQSSKNPTLEKSTSGKSVLEVEPSSKEKPSSTAKSKVSDNLQKSVTKRYAKGYLDNLFNEICKSFFSVDPHRLPKRFPGGRIGEIRKLLMNIYEDMMDEELQPGEIVSFRKWVEKKIGGCNLRSLTKMGEYFTSYLQEKRDEKSAPAPGAPIIDPVDLTDEQRQAAASKLDAARDRMRETQNAA